MGKRILVLVYMILIISFFAGCADNNFVLREYSVEGTEVKAIVISVRDRWINVAPSHDGQIHIDYSESLKEGYDIGLSDSGVLTMESVSHKDWTDYIGVKPSAGNRKISVRIPERILDSLSLSTTNADLSVDDISVFSSVSLSSNGGSVNIENIDAGETVSLNAKNGDIKGSIYGSYDDFSIRTDVKKGDCNLPERKDEGEKSLYVKINNGDADIEFVN